MGSPPHTRDKYNGETSTLASSRIIPAYAGQMMVLKAPAYPCWDHPRIRGTNVLDSSHFFVVWGSSPHTRDKSYNASYSGRAIRIIPAYAGQINLLEQLGAGGEDHPRIRGTNARMKREASPSLGSPPHTRDKFIFGKRPLHCFGITPAYAEQILIIQS